MTMMKTLMTTMTWRAGKGRRKERRWTTLEGETLTLLRNLRRETLRGQTSSLSWSEQPRPDEDDDLVWTELQ